MEIRASEWDLNLRSLEDRVGQSQAWGFAVKREGIGELWMAAFFSGQAWGSTKHSMGTLGLRDQRRKPRVRGWDKEQNRCPRTLPVHSLFSSSYRVGCFKHHREFCIA